MSIHKNAAQELCNELFRASSEILSSLRAIEGAYTNNPEEYLRQVEASLLALEEARSIMKAFLKRHRQSR